MVLPGSFHTRLRHELETKTGGEVAACVISPSRPGAGRAVQLVRQPAGATPTYRVRAPNDAMRPATDEPRDALEPADCCSSVQFGVHGRNRTTIAAAQRPGCRIKQLLTSRGCQITCRSSSSLTIA